MWIKAQNGNLYNSETFGSILEYQANSIVHSLVGIDRARERCMTELLRYSSFTKRDFIDIAKRRIENALVHKHTFVDLSDICKIDYTAEEIGI